MVRAMSFNAMSFKKYSALIASLSAVALVLAFFQGNQEPDMDAMVPVEKEADRQLNAAGKIARQSCEAARGARSP